MSFFAETALKWSSRRVFYASGVEPYRYIALMPGLGEFMSNSEAHVLEHEEETYSLAANSDAHPANEFTYVAETARIIPLDRRIDKPFDVASSKAKRAFDILGSVIGIIVTAPLMAVVFLMVKRDGGPGIFVQQRVGRDGALFPCFKFRTMAPNAEEALQEILRNDSELKKYWDANRKLPADPRVTPLGVFLRRKSLDELPQLMNVLLGHMSIVGPRPIVPEEQECYGDDFRFYQAARPGLTGAWQVSGRNERTYAERVALDVDYVSNWRFGKDVRIVIETVGAVLSGKGAS